MAEKSRPDTNETPINKAALALGMTPEGVRRLCLRTGFGERDSRGHWVLTASEIEEIKRARAIVWGGGNE